jgi:CPA1 family monovalent cation:H+ antiporter
VQTIELVFALLACLAVLAAVARRVDIPYPMMLVLGGLAISLVPGVEPVRLDPELVFFLFLPPILSAAGYFTPIRDFRFNLRSILLLAVGLVLFTMVVVAVVARGVIPDLPWGAAFALGAIVAPPDAIAATSVTQRMALPRRIITVLEGESLLNDATALIAYRAAVAATLTGAFSLAGVGGDFLISGLGGLAIGALFGWLTARLLRLIGDTTIEIILTFLASFGAYLLAEQFHVSGVLAAVAMGLVLGRMSTQVMTAESRVQGEAVWQVVVFLINGLVFVLLGLQLPSVLAGLAGRSPWELAGYGAAVSLAIIVARIVWMPFGAYLPRFLSARIRASDPYPPWQNVAIVSWAGMRGIVSLAAALSLPAGFPERDLLIFLTFCVILATLIGQGLTLPFLIRWLGVRDDGGGEREEAKARFVAARAGLERLEELALADWTHEEHVADMRAHYEARQSRFLARYRGEDGDGHEQRGQASERLEGELIAAELSAVVRLRDDGVINDEVLRRVQRDLDLERLRLRNNGDQ